MQALKIEKDMLSQISHPFIIKTERIFLSEHRIYQLMPYCQGRDLSFYMRSEKRIKESTVKFIAAQIVMGIGELHSKKILYRDLKPENILINSDGYVMIADFGISKVINQSNTFIGTPTYIGNSLS
jgi:serum/glucocorticoid-regulated kinase 2